MIKYRTKIWEDFSDPIPVTKISILRKDNDGRYGVVYQGAIDHTFTLALSKILETEANDGIFEYIELSKEHDNE